MGGTRIRLWPRDTVLTKTKSQKARARASRAQNKRALLKGSGAYDMSNIKAALKPVVREALANAGAAIGGMSGPHGAAFGKVLGQKLSRIIGSGDYESNTSVNSLIHPPGGMASASFAPDQDVVRIRRREFLGDVLAPAVAGTFTNYPYSINPGLKATFPFLSQMAPNYEEYCFDGLVFEFISSASPYISSSALGTVIAAMEYNASGPTFSSKYQMENSAHAISTRLDKNLMYGVECAKGANAQNCYYVRTGTSVLPVTTTDLGTFQLAVAPSASVPASTVLGELWVTYDICLKRPILNTSRYGVYHLYCSDTAVLPARPLGNTVVTETNLGGASFTRASASTITFANATVGDQYLLTWWIVGGTNAAGVPTVPGITSGVGNVLSHNFLYNDLASYTAGGQASGGAYVTGVATLLVNFTFQLTASTGTITFGTTGTNWPSGAGGSEVIISYIGNNLKSGDF